MGKKDVKLGVLLTYVDFWKFYDQLICIGFYLMVMIFRFMTDCKSGFLLLKMRMKEN